MTILYSTIDNTWFAQPQFIRTRHRFRGVKESQKFNLELDQLLYDFTKLYADYTTLTEGFKDGIDLLYDGGAIIGAQYYWPDQHSPVLTNFVAEGLSNLVARATNLQNRVRTLENN